MNHHLRDVHGYTKQRRDIAYFQSFRLPNDILNLFAETSKLIFHVMRELDWEFLSQNLFYCELKL